MSDTARNWCMRAAAVVIVCSLGGPAATGETIVVPDDYATIQEAIDAAVTGDEIVVAAGTYTENLVIQRKAISLSGESGAEATTIVAADDQAPVLFVFATDGEGLVSMDNLTLTGGRGGIECAFADALIEHCDVLENMNGPGIDVFFSNVTVSGCSIAINGGSNIPGGGVTSSLSMLELRDTSLTENRGSTGGAVFLQETVAEFLDCTFENNEAEDGGGVFVALAEVVMSNTSFHKNVSLNDGGAMAVGDELGTVVELDQCTVQSNSARDGGGFWIGSQAEAHLAETSFCGNGEGHISGRWNDLGGNDFSEFCIASGDFNGDGLIDVSDLLIVLGAWGPCPEDDGCPADLDGDGVVDASDLMILLANWTQ